MSDDRVLDRRRRRTRIVTDLWRRWDAAPPAWLPLASALTRPLVRAGLRRRLASRTPAPTQPRIVSVGALASGGSGKTPVTLQLAAGLSGAGEAVAIICRGYGSPESGPLRVAPENRRCGDEARLLAASLPDVVVVQAADRRAGLDWLGVSFPDRSLVLLEDGHQCAGAGRHLDVLILDRWRLRDGRVVPGTGHLLPWGPWREEVDGAARARLWLLPMAATETAPELVAAGEGVLGFRRRSRLPADVATAHGSAYGVLSGLADPAAFEVACADLTGAEPALAVRCDDHARYDASEVAGFVAAGARVGVEHWLTTAKDHVKLGPVWPDDAPPLHVVELELAWVGGDPAAKVLTLLEA